MGKNVYSLVLSDEVINEIDKLAYANSTSRSNMINQILAEYVSYTTPEKRMHDIFDRMQSLLLGTDFGRNAFQLQSIPSDTMFSLRSAIAYKYNPSVRYSVELYKTLDDNGNFGELRVGLRTQNRALIACISDFYSFWHRTECSSFKKVQASSDGERYTRKLHLSIPEGSGKDITGLTVGDVISSYINTFDQALKAYFELLGTGADPDPVIRKIYKQYLKEEVYV